jgi:hypothetical protein
VLPRARLCESWEVFPSWFGALEGRRKTTWPAEKWSWAVPRSRQTCAPWDKSLTCPFICASGQVSDFSHGATTAPTLGHGDLKQYIDATPSGSGRQIAFVQAAVFATMPGTRANTRADRRLHTGFRRPARRMRALAWRMATKWPAITYVSYSRRSCGVSSPSLHFSANFATCSCVLRSAFMPISLRAASPH